MPEKTITLRRYALVRTLFDGYAITRQSEQNPNAYTRWRTHVNPTPASKRRLKRLLKLRGWQRWLGGEEHLTVFCEVQAGQVINPANMPLNHYASLFQDRGCIIIDRRTRAQRRAIKKSYVHIRVYWLNEMTTASYVRLKRFLAANASLFHSYVSSQGEHWDYDPEGE